MLRQADRDEKVADDTFLEDDMHDNVVQSNDSERTRHISMQPPPTQHALLQVQWDHSVTHF